MGRPLAHSRSGTCLGIPSASQLGFQKLQVTCSWLNQHLKLLKYFPSGFDPLHLKKAPFCLKVFRQPPSIPPSDLLDALESTKNLLLL